jgi:hypothetical protein
VSEIAWQKTKSKQMEILKRRDQRCLSGDSIFQMLRPYHGRQAFSAKSAKSASKNSVSPGFGRRYVSFDASSKGTADIGCKLARQAYLSGGLCLWMQKASKSPAAKQNPRKSAQSADSASKKPCSSVQSVAKSGKYQLSNHYAFFKKQTQFSSFSAQKPRFAEKTNPIKPNSKPIFWLYWKFFKISDNQQLLFMQNEPNFVRRWRITSAFMTKRYDNIMLLSGL